mgnify:CR=1 FL=1
MEQKTKDIINCEKGERKLYQDLNDSEYFKTDRELGIVTIFGLAAALGFKNKNYKPLSSQEWLTRSSYIEKNTSLNTFCTALAVAHYNSLEIYEKEQDAIEIYEIAERYANGGIKLLHQMVTDHQSSDFDKQLEELLMAVSGK